MFVELITTGSELLLGSTLNSHQQWLGQRLAALGMPVCRQLTVPDSGTEIANAVADAIPRADLIITTGGLGPTSDDRTRDQIAALLGLSLREDATVADHIRHLFKRLGRLMPSNFAELVRIQSMVPDGATVLTNAVGSAPGLAIRIDPKRWRRENDCHLVMLPGPPRELRPLFELEVAPYLRRAFPNTGGFLTRTFQTIGVGESRVEDAIKGPLQALVERGLEIGYCARTGEVDVRLAARGDAAAALLEEGSGIVGRLLGHCLYSVDGKGLETVVVEELKRRNKTVVTAESCTGGHVADTLTNVPGASEVFLGGLVTYSNELKESLLGVRRETLADHGAVSEATAREMASGARERFAADFAIAITGIAGPTGGTVEKPVGTVFIALAGPSGVRIERKLNPFDRETFKFITARQSLEMLRQALKGIERQK